MKVLLADDEELLRSGLSTLIATQSDMELVGEAGDGRSAVEEALLRRPDVIAMDIRMPRLDGIAATREILERSTHRVSILILTTFDLDTYVYEALRAGAGGFMLKSAAPAQFADALRVVGGGEMLLAPSVTRRLVEDFVAGPAPGGSEAALAELTEREREVLLLIANGLSNAEIAERLFVSDATAKTHVARVLSKLELRNRVQAVIYAYEHGLVTAAAT